jgi:hypothetical protein
MKLDIDFLEPLYALSDDVDRAAKEMDSGDDPYLRRNYVRTVFAMIEGTIYLLKQILIEADSSKQAQSVGKLSTGELALLGEKTFNVTDKGEVRDQPKYLSTAANLRFTMKCIEKVFKHKVDLNDADAWKNLENAVVVRNRITHPKKLGDLEVSKTEAEQAKRVSQWFTKFVIDWFGQFLSGAKVVKSKPSKLDGSQK